MAILVGIIAAQQLQLNADQEILTYSMALKRTIEHDPRFKLSDALVEAAEGQVEQANQYPNPVIGVEVENVLGTGPVSGVDSAEITVGISQTIETADKRARRTALARSGEILLDWERAMLQAEIETNVRIAFVRGLLAQEYVTLREEELLLAQESERETSRLVEAARSPQVERTRATLAVRQQQFALKKSMRELVSARMKLASLWDRPEDGNFQIKGELVLDPNLPEFSQLVAMLPETAQLSRFQALRKHRQAELELEQAQSTSDFEIFAGGRYFNEGEGDLGFAAGIEVPLRLFNKNTGNIRTARAQVRAVEHEREATRRALLIRLNEAYQDLVTAHAEAVSVQSELLPVAEQTLAEVSEGYEKGQYSQLAVLESRLVLFEIREAYLDALQRYVMAQVQIEAITRPVSHYR